MTFRTPLLLACLALATIAAAPSLAADPQREIHGMADAYAGDGAAVAWAVLRGADEAGTVVVVRIVADPDPTCRHATGSNPFSQERSVVAATLNAGSVGFRGASTVADFPRTELRFYATAAAAQPTRPPVVYFPACRYDAGVRDRGESRGPPRRLRSAQSAGSQSAVTRAELARIIDHSVLKPEATGREIRAGADVVRSWHIGFYCVQPCWIKVAAEALDGTDARVVGVIGFPHGCDRAEVKARAATIAAGEGAAEIDMVMNFGALKSGHAMLVTSEIEDVVRAASAAPVKVILEAATLSEAESTGVPDRPRRAPGSSRPPPAFIPPAAQPSPTCACCAQPSVRSSASRPRAGSGASRTRKRWSAPARIVSAPRPAPPFSARSRPLVEQGAESTAAVAT